MQARDDSDLEEGNTSGFEGRGGTQGAVCSSKWQDLIFGERVLGRKRKVATSFLVDLFASSAHLNKRGNTGLSVWFLLSKQLL